MSEIKFFVSIILLTCITSTVHSQHANVWVFGGHAGVDFNSMPPRAIKTEINTGEGSASICDANGQLLFYTDGCTVWDKNQNIMPNGQDLPQVGKNITSSTTQGTIIIPWPGRQNQYFIFSLGQITGSDNNPDHVGKLYYSVIDMDLNGGLGDAVVASKGIVLDSLLTEQMTAVSGNNCDIWLIVSSRLTDTLKAFNINFDGIEFPVCSAKVGTSRSRNAKTGSLDISPDRKRLASAWGDLAIYDFDIISGKISNPLLLPEYGNYGVAFSPDNSKLYATYFGLYQFDLSSNNAAAIASSRQQLADHIFGSIKRGPDGKMYIAAYDDNALHVIQQPNLAGPACQYRSKDLALLPGTDSYISLPNVATVVPVIPMNTFVKDSASCVDSFPLSATNLHGDHYTWNDGLSGASRYVSKSGNYWVRYLGKDADGRCIQFTDSFSIILRLTHRFYSNSRLDGKCKADTLLLRARTEMATNYIWEDNSDGMQRSINKNGIYWVNYQNDSLCALYTDSFIVTYPEQDYKVSFNTDTLVCQNKTLIFQNTSDKHFHQFAWSFGNMDTSTLTQPNYAFIDPGTYQVRLIGKIENICPDTAFKKIVVDPILKNLVYSKDKENICAGESILFTPLTDYTTIRLLWTFGEDRPLLSSIEPISHAFEKKGNISITLYAQFRACPELQHTDTIKVYAYPLVDLGPDAALCLRGRSLTIHNLATNNPGHYHYRWNPDGDTTETLNIKHPGQYTLSISNNQGCTTTEAISVAQDCYLDIPNSFTPNGDGINDYFFPRQLLSKSIIRFKMQIFNRWGGLIFETSTWDGRGWDGRSNGLEQSLGVYPYLIDLEIAEQKTEHYQGNVTLIR